MTSIKAAEPSREEIARLRAFVSWVDSWVSNPVGAYSVSALDGLFGMTRDKIAVLSLPQAREPVAWIDAAALQAAHEIVALSESWTYARKKAAIQVIVAREMTRAASPSPVPDAPGGPAFQPENVRALKPQDSGK